MIRVSRGAAEAVQGDGSVVFTPKLADLRREMEQRAMDNSERAHPVLVNLALWANDFAGAQHWLQASQVAWQRVLASKSEWRTISLIPLGTPFWSYSRQMIVNMAWLAGIQLAEDGLNSDALQWFRRGISLVPGRVPENVHRAYYRSLSAWYLTQPPTPNNRRASAKFACLADERFKCLQSIANEMPVKESPDWIITGSAPDSLVAANGWQILGFDLDEDIIDAGVDVAGVLYWQTGKDNKVELRRQPFIATNLVPNPGFEFQHLFVDACVDGYIGSHAFVLPCVSQIEADPLKHQIGLVATTQTSETGYLLIGAPVKATSGRTYAFGAQLCSIAGAEAKFGLQLTSEQAAEQNAYDGLSWPITNLSSGSSACWTRKTSAGVATSGTETARVWLGGFGDHDALRANALFDSVFLFDLSDLLQTPAD
jgi:hypothetical protein